MTPASSIRARTSLRSAMVWQFVLVAALPLLLIGIPALNYLVDLTRASGLAQGRATANAAASQVHSILSEPEAALVRLVGVIEARRLDRDLPVERLLAQALRENELLAALQLCDGDGRGAESAQRAPAPASSTALCDAPEVRRRVAALGGHEGQQWTAPFELPGSQVRVVALLLRIEEAVLAGAIDLERLESRVAALDAAPRATSSVATTDTELLIVGADGRVLYQPGGSAGGRRLSLPSRTDAGGDGAELPPQISYTVSGRHFVGVTAPIVRTPWSVVAGESLERSQRPVRSLVVLFVLGMVGALVVAALAARLFAARLTRPLDRFGEAVRGIASNHFEEKPAPLPYSEIEGVAASLREMSETIRAREGSLRESRQHYLTLFNAGPDAVFVWPLAGSKAGSFSAVNDVACSSLGYSREELLAMSPLDIAEPDAVERVASQLRDEDSALIETVHRRKDGGSFEVRVHSRRFELGGHPFAVSVARDKTREADLEARLSHAQKMEAIGTLAGGIAHDFNNILGVLMGYVELAQMDAGDNPPLVENLVQVRIAANRAADLVRQILTFSRQAPQERRPLRIQPIVRESLKLLRGALPARIEISEEIDVAVGPVLGDPTEVHQVVMNLATNAYHAMRERGGQLYVRLDQVQLEGARPHGVDLPAGHYLRLQVSDTGHGMPPEVRQRIFEPYFTTKSAAEGTGLGLATVHGIIRAYGGDIAVESEVGRGTNFSIFIPVCTVPEPAEEAAGPEGEVPRGDERVLLVDDEEKIVELHANFLRSLGYTVVAHTRATRAWAAFEATPHFYDLVILDQMMPRLTGLELADRMRRKRPDIPILLWSGYAEEVSEERLRKVDITSFMMKPVMPGDLARTVRRLLGARITSPNR